MKLEPQLIQPPLPGGQARGNQQLNPADAMTTMAAIDRLVHHSIILEFDGPSQRIQKAAEPAEINEPAKAVPESQGQES